MLIMWYYSSSYIMLYFFKKIQFFSETQKQEGLDLVYIQTRYSAQSHNGMV